MENPISKPDVEAIVCSALVGLRDDLGLSALEKVHPETPLLGGGSDMDSMSVVHLVVDLEARLNERFGKNWILADERALSRRRSPFRTVGDLSDFIIETTPSS